MLEFQGFIVVQEQVRDPGALLGASTPTGGPQVGHRVNTQLGPPVYLTEEEAGEREKWMALT